jgi:hypothetical protein
VSRWFVLTSLLIVSGIGRLAGAHQVPNSVVDFDFGADLVRAELLMPASELRLAFRDAPVSDGPHATPGQDAALRAYVLQHVHANAPDGRPWNRAIDSVRVVQLEAHDYIDMVISMKPPPNMSAREFTWIDDAITHQVMNHFIMLVVRSDYDAGLIGQDSKLIGFLQHPKDTFTINRGIPSAGSGFRAAFELGVDHIAAGADHLLFLLTLLLPASLIAVNGRWQTRRLLAATLRRLAAIVTAFTIGHSLTLIGSVAFGWQVSSQPVEVLIAMSILVSAIHAWRPLFPGRESLVAGGFGLIHGLAFASALGSHVVDPSSKALTIVGFNLGIETFQIVIVAITVPLLCLLRPTGISVAVRRFGAAFAGTSAIVWGFERLDLGAAIRRYFADTPSIIECIGAMLGVTALVFAIWTRGRFKTLNNLRPMQ